MQIHADPDPQPLPGRRSGPGRHGLQTQASGSDPGNKHVRQLLISDELWGTLILYMCTVLVPNYAVVHVYQVMLSQILPFQQPHLDCYVNDGYLRHLSRSKEHTLRRTIGTVPTCMEKYSKSYGNRISFNFRSYVQWYRTFTVLSAPGIGRYVVSNCAQLISINSTDGRKRI